MHFMHKEKNYQWLVGVEKYRIQTFFFTFTTPAKRKWGKNMHHWEFSVVDQWVWFSSRCQHAFSLEQCNNTSFSKFRRPIFFYFVP
jgi:hypothetical protein